MEGIGYAKLRGLFLQLTQIQNCRVQQKITAMQQINLKH